MAAKRTIYQDPEYEAIPAEIQEKRIKLIEDNVRNQTKKKIISIIKSNFEEEISKKHEEIETIDESLHEGRYMLDRLRACIITKYYATLGFDQKPDSVPPIHPCVKKYTGKSPRDINRNIDYNLETSKPIPCPEKDATTSNLENSSTVSSDPVLEKIWESKPSTSQVDDVSSRAPRFKKKCKIVVGNISKFIPVWQRDASDQSTHKWMVYVRGDKNEPNIDSFVKKVRFLLHPSYRPTDIVDITNPPFHLVKRGWGEFPVRVQLHFHDPRNKPVDIIHNLKLDKTFTGLQTLGSETVVELHLFKPESEVNSSNNLMCSSSSSSQMSAFASKSDINITVAHNGPVSSKVNSTSEKESNLPTIVKRGTNSLILNIKMPKSTTNNNKTYQVSNVNSHTASSTSHSSSILPNSSDSDSQKKIVPKIVISNNKILNKPVTTNGLNATFVKVTDKNGRVLLVPKSSLTFKAPPNSIKMNNANSVVNHDKASVDKNINKTVPSYILKLVPNQQSGQKKVFLVPTNKKTNNTSETNNIIHIKKEPIEDEPLTSIESNIESVIKKEPDFEETVETSPYLHYEELLENIRMEYCKTFEDLLKRVSKVFPLVRKGVDRQVFTFCANTLDEFHSWNIGKQRASEWKRAGMVRKSIIDIITKNPNSSLTLDCLWTQSCIMLWLRKNGFVPMAREKLTLLPEPKWTGVELCSLTNADDLLCSLKEEENDSLVKVSEEEEDVEIIDVINVKDESKKSSKETSSQEIYLPHFSDEALFIKHTAGQLGIEIKPIEVEPHLHAPVVEEMILAACKRLVEDLVGSSLNEGYHRLGDKMCPEEVTVCDVYTAIKNIPQYDFLTNSYLGVPKETSDTT